MLSSFCQMPKIQSKNLIAPTDRQTGKLTVGQSGYLRSFALENIKGVGGQEGGSLIDQ